MRIAHFVRGFGLKGGVAAYVESLINLQLDLGHEVWLFDTSHDNRPHFRFEVILVGDEQELFKHCQSRAVDILHYHTELTISPPAQLPTVCTVHGHSPHCISGGLFLSRRNEPCPRTFEVLGCTYGHIRDRCGSVRPFNVLKNVRRMTRQMKILPNINTIAVGNFVKDRMVHAGYPAEKITVVPNFTDIGPKRELILPSGVPEFLFIGRVERSKGIEWLLQSIKGAACPVFLHIAGEGSDLETTRALIGALGISERVIFHGWIDRAQKIELFRRARAVIVPSIWPEPFGIVAIEAGACSRPVIASSAGELPHIVRNGETGSIVPISDIQALRVAIENMAANAQRSQEMGNAGLRRYSQFYTPAAHWTQIEQIYKRTISQWLNHQNHLCLLATKKH